ncbi:hypothetical protein [Adlercreutzia faecimuris]|uniref:Uncharacterized protein n=1 Tax=Adlercreutzia faecimuris TaxID=2897341 RepID=A0ABS9WJB8_9ACTN|nr:hypothetical protein [Adlercreutzia sp. JBNU-10]MCI2242610.1 hypothetical protein [Adlercreutzia sp. JBNU-10]
MTLDQVTESYGDLVADWNCIEAYIGPDGALYYRYDETEPVTEPGQITFNKVAEVGADPVPVSSVEFHEAQKGTKLK